MRIHIHDHEINQGRRILELNQHILCYPIGLHHNGVYQSQLMRGMDQWVLVQVVIDRLGQDVLLAPQSQELWGVLVLLAYSKACRG
jgi:hypothetical protein